MNELVSQAEVKCIFDALEPIKPGQAIKFRKKKPAGKESALVSHCIKWLYAHGCYVWRNNTGAYKPEAA